MKVQFCNYGQHHSSNRYILSIPIKIIKITSAIFDRSTGTVMHICNEKGTTLADKEYNYRKSRSGELSTLALLSMLEGH